MTTAPVRVYGGHISDHTAQLREYQKQAIRMYAIAAEVGATIVWDEINFANEEQRAEFERRCKEVNV